MLTVIFDLLNLILVSMYNSGDSINISGPLFCNLQSGGNNTYLLGVLRTHIMCMQGCSRSILI